jgi:hypothetical protein
MLTRFRALLISILTHDINFISSKKKKTPKVVVKLFFKDVSKKKNSSTKIFHFLNVVVANGVKSDLKIEWGTKNKKKLK